MTTEIKNAIEKAAASRRMAEIAAEENAPDADRCADEAHADACELAELLCRGRYQRQIVNGSARLSGSDLKGRARRFSGRYAASRRSILSRLASVGVEIGEIRGERGLRVLTIAGRAV